MLGEKYGVAWQDIQYFNNIVNPNDITQNVIYIPYSSDPIATNYGYANENKYDYWIVEYAISNYINPMLEKAQVWHESAFNTSEISGDVPCGGGHSYGLLQWTPMCQNVPQPGVVSATANSVVWCSGGTCGFQNKVYINCLSTCTSGDWLLTERNKSGSNVTVSALTSPSFSQSYYDNSVFNSTYNLKIGEGLVGNSIATEMSNWPNCNYADQQILGMGLYNGVNFNPNGCTYTNNYMNLVESAYSTFVSYAINHAWCDEYTTQCSNVYGTSVSEESESVWRTDYTYGDNWFNYINWNNSEITDTGYSIQSSTYQPWCPIFTSVSIQISGTAHGDSYSRYLSLNFSDGLSTEQLVTKTTVSGSFSLNYTVGSTYLTTHGTASAPYYLTTYVGYWNITESIHYDSSSTC